MNKRGQFYLIAAFVIIGLIVGASTVYIFTRTSKEGTTIEDLHSEITLEVREITNSGVFNEVDNIELDNRLEDLIEYYSGVNPNTDFFFVHGGKTTLTFLFYNNTGIGSIEANYNGPIILEGGPDVLMLEVPRTETNEINVSINGLVTESYDLGLGRAAFLIIKRERNGESFLATPNS